jgi:poly-beta-1,6-N-acetyl-D-glucosamine synthase
MRLPGRKTTAYGEPDVLERPRLGITRRASAAAARETQGVLVETRERALGEARPVLGDPDAALPYEESTLRETALVETAPALRDTAARPRKTRRRRRRARRRLYIPLRVRVLVTFAAGVSWLAFSTWVSRHWIAQLGTDISVPLAILVVSGIALIPGYLNIQLLTSIMLDRPPRLRMDVEFPPVVLLIAAYNEQGAIAETLDYALRSDYPGSFEIVVADDGSKDRTREIVREYELRDDRVRLLEVDHGGKAEALNAALRDVLAPLVATIDADTLLMPYSLRRAVARLSNSPEDTVAVAGAVLARNSRDNLLTRAQEWDYFLGIASVKRAQALLQGTLVAQGAFSVYETAAVKLAGGWPNRIGEDIVLTWRMLANGGRAVFEPTAVAFTDVPATWWAFARQRRRWARGMIEGLRDHGMTLLRRLNFYSHSVAANFVFPLLDTTFTFAFIPGIALAAFGNFTIVGPMTLLVLPLNVVLGGVMFLHQRRVFHRVNLRVRKNKTGLIFYFLFYQFAMAPISVAGYVLETVRAHRAW